MLTWNLNINNAMAFCVQLLIVVIVFTVFVTMASCCPAHMLPYGNKCISINKEKLSFDDAGVACRNEGGTLAGEKVNILALFRNNPQVWKLLPEPADDTRFWAHPDMTLFQMAVTIVFNALGGNDRLHCLVYKSGEWKTISLEIPLVRSMKLQSFCEISQPEEPEIKPSGKNRERKKMQTSGKNRERKKTQTSVIRKLSTGMYHVDSPVFQTRVPSVTFCSRTCISDTNCDTVNFSPSTGLCIGYKQAGTDTYENIPGWEIWSMAQGSTTDLSCV